MSGQFALAHLIYFFSLEWQNMAVPKSYQPARYVLYVRIWRVADIMVFLLALAAKHFSDAQSQITACSNAWEMGSVR
ncbi:hypothetical protein M3Y97_00068300 [Aphelenchoides bicaudatus]|nr:hypothetical protein M3Y97_00068300 [Aphelenchoides bicaudatus]